MKNTCGQCRHFMMGNFSEPMCRKTNKRVGWFDLKDCFESLALNNNESKKETIMENNKTTKVCADCGRELPIEEFGKNFRSKDGYNNICRECKGKRYKKGDKSSEETKTEMKSTHLSKLTDMDLVDELRARGWDVKCTKTIEL